MKDERVELLLRKLTLEEKVSMAAGSGPWHSTGVPRLGIPALKLSDGPNAVRGEGTPGARATCFPVGVALGASFDPELLREVGAALAEEARSKGAQILLGPTINLQRTPIGGRNFECYSEDPLLTGVLAAAFVAGVQSRGVGACPKHFVCNDTERDRHTVSAEVSERALRELYLRPFERVVREADPWCLMSAYNRINGIHASAHRELLRDVLKGEWGFSGFVVSDWGASRETEADANAGLDLEMPGPARTLGDKLLAAVREGRVSEATVDDKVRRLLTALVRTGRLDAPDPGPERNEDTPEKRALARRAAVAGMVLLRNEPVAGAAPLLPLDPRGLRRIALIGPNARVAQLQGGGSSRATPQHPVHPLAALRDRLGHGVELEYEVGCRAPKYVPPLDPRRLASPAGAGGFELELFDAPDGTGLPVHSGLVRGGSLLWFGGAAPGVRTRHFSARLGADFTPADSGVHVFGLASAGSARLRVDGAEVVDNTQPVRGESFYGWGSTELRGEARLEAGVPVRIEIEYERSGAPVFAGLRFGALPPLPEDAMERAERAAAAAEVALVLVGTDGDWETEGNDRSDMALPGRQVELIERVVRANPNTAVVVNAGSPVELDWLDRVPAALQVWFPGQEFGGALCDVLFGEEDPGGRLPISFPARLEDTPAFPYYPGRDRRMPYGEDLLVGYRHYDTTGVAPRLPFGHGLSYTRFVWGELEVAPELGPGETLRAALEVTNTGERPGCEVVQLYLSEAAPPLPRPAKELVAFRKLRLGPGETARVSLEVAPDALACWDPARRAWHANPGRFELLAGASAADIRSRKGFTLQAPLPRDRTAR